MQGYVRVNTFTDRDAHAILPKVPRCPYAFGFMIADKLTWADLWAEYFLADIADTESDNTEGRDTRKTSCVPHVLIHRANGWPSGSDTYGRNALPEL